MLIETEAKIFQIRLIHDKSDISTQGKRSGLVDDDSRTTFIEVLRFMEFAIIAYVGCKG